MNLVPKFEWSGHALRRWKERGGGDDWERENALRNARPCGIRMLKNIRKKCKTHKPIMDFKEATGWFYIYSNPWIFVVKDRLIVTVFPYQPPQDEL